MKVLVYSAKNFEIPCLESANKGRHKLTFTDAVLNAETVMAARGFQAISVFTSDHVSNRVLEKLHEFGINYVALRSVGFDNVNLFAADELKIKVANVPAYSPYAVAEHAIGLLLAFNRKLIQSNARVKKFNFDITGLTGFDLNNKTVGILGTGKIGAVMAKILHGFGCKLLAFDMHENKLLSVQYHIKYVSLATLCKASDIISIHLPLNADTYHLIDKKLIDLMKPNCLIVNTARGGIIDTEAILEALTAHQILGLATDVYEHEKDLFFKDHSQDILKDDLLIKLNSLSNVLMTGHHAFLTEEALANIADATIYNLNTWEEGKALGNELHFVYRKAE